MWHFVESSRGHTASADSHHAADISSDNTTVALVSYKVAIHNVDYYITKYAAKPMEQLQNLVTQYAVDLRRLELEEAESDQQLKAHEASEAMKLVAPVRDWKTCGRRVLLRIQYVANRTKWISSTEAALYVHTEQQHSTSHGDL